MTKRRYGAMLVSYSAEVSLDSPPRPVARSRFKVGTWQLTGRPCAGLIRGGGRLPATCSAATSMTGAPPLRPYLPAPRGFLRVDVPRDHPRSLRPRRQRPVRWETCSLASGGARSSPPPLSSSPPPLLPPPRPRRRGCPARRFRGLVCGGDVSWDSPLPPLQSSPSCPLRPRLWTTTIQTT